MGSIKYHTTRVLVWYLTVSELNPGPDGIDPMIQSLFDGQIQIGPPIGWNPDVPYGTRMCRMEPGYFGRAKMSQFAVELRVQVIG